jgi:hypothetical protein
MSSAFSMQSNGGEHLPIRVEKARDVDASLASLAATRRNNAMLGLLEFVIDTR